MTHIWTRVTEFGNKTKVKIELCYWLLLCVHMTKTNQWFKSCDRICSKFSPPLFGLHNQKGTQALLLYLPTKLMLRSYVLTLIFSLSARCAQTKAELRYLGIEGIGYYIGMGLKSNNCYPELIKQNYKQFSVSCMQHKTCDVRQGNYYITSYWTM